MTRVKMKWWLPAFSILILVATVAAAEGFTLISKDQLKGELKNPNTYILDVRVQPEWDSSQFKIEGAHRESPAEVDKWMTNYPKNKTIVLYCD